MSGLKIGGLGSGMDTQMMLEQLMRAERMPLDRMKQQKQVLQWKQEDYRGINTKLLKFRDKAADMRFPRMYNARNISSSNSNVVTGTASSNAATGTYVVEVEKVGSKAFANSASEVEFASGRNANSTLENAFADSFGLHKVQALDEEGTPKTDANGNTIYIFSKDEAGNYLNSQGEIIDLTTHDFRIGNKTFTFASRPEEPERDVVYLDIEKDTLNTLATKVNNSNAGVHMVYDAGQNKAFMSSSQEGVTNILGEDADGAIEAMGFLGNQLNFNLQKDPISGDIANVNGYTAGEAAVVKVNGHTLTNNSSNSFTFAGVNFNITERGTSTITVTSDTEKVMDNIKDFVNEYNSLITSINEKLFETRNRDYPPLTDEQKEQLSDRQAEKWEEIAREGHLRNDTMLQGVLTNLRSIMGGVVEGIDGISSLSQIGISSRDYSERGILHIDENRLRKAIEENPDGVQRLFVGDGTNEGLSQKLRSAATSSMDRIGQAAGRSTALTDQSFIGRSIKSIDDRIERFEDRLQRVENRYWRQFTAMEKAMDQMYNQSQWLSQQLMTMF